MQRISLFLLLIGLCMLALSSCDVPNGDGSYTSVNQSSSQASGLTDYRSLARQDAIDAGISPDLYERQINQESGFNPNAVSSAGAIGIAQILPSTANGWGVDPHDPVASLRAAANAMAQYQNTYGSYDKALAAYNCGTGCLNSAMQRCSYYRYCLPSETARYISAIMG